ncbi:unnamed protein product, partial [Mesorhabditis spiculigera]
MSAGVPSVQYNGNEPNNNSGKGKVVVREDDGNGGGIDNEQPNAAETRATAAAQTISEQQFQELFSGHGELPVEIVTPPRGRRQQSAQVSPGQQPTAAQKSAREKAKAKKEAAEKKKRKQRKIPSSGKPTAGPKSQKNDSGGRVSPDRKQSDSPRQSGRQTAADGKRKSESKIRPAEPPQFEPAKSSASRDQVGFTGKLKFAFKKVFKDDQLEKNEHLLKEGDDLAPTKKGKDAKQKKKMVVKDDKVEDVAATSIRIKDIALREDLVLVKNFDNNGQLFIKNRPFWRAMAPEEEDTNDTLPMASTVVLDVANKTIALTEPPDEDIKFDVYAEQATLAARDADHFSRELIFGNTVRNIIATMNCDDSQQREDNTRCPHIWYKDQPTRMQEYKFNPLTHEMKSREMPYVRTNIGVVHGKTKDKGLRRVMRFIFPPPAV